MLAVDPDGEIRDHDEDAEGYSKFWERALTPGAASYEDLVAQAVSILEQNLGADDARTILSDAVARRPGAPLAHFWLGVLERAEGRFGACAASFARTLALEPDFEPPGGKLPGRAAWAVELELGLCLALDGDLSEAARRLTRITTGHPSCVESPRDPGCYGWEIPWRLGEILMGLGRLEEAIANLEAARSTPQSRIEARYTLAVALERDEQLSEARRLLDATVTQDFNSASLTAPARLYIPTTDRHYYLGLASQIRGDHGRAAIHFRGYLAAAPSSPWAPRARLHLETATAPAIGSDAELSGGASIERAALIEALVAAGPRLERCVAALPEQLFEVRIAAEIEKPGRGKRQQLKKTARINWYNLLQVDTETAAVTQATSCLKSAAEKVALPPLSGPSGAVAVIKLSVYARRAAP